MFFASGFVASTPFGWLSPVLQDPITLASDLAYSMQEYQRTAGYDAVAVNWDDSNSQHPPADLQGDLPLQGHMDYVGMSEKQFDRLQLLQEQLQEIIRQTRVTGYDVPAVDADSMDEFGTLAPLGATSAGAADSGVVRDLDKLEQARQYFKNPCNSPAAQQDHKNSFNHDAHRMYYKNPANVPVVLHQQPSQVRQELLCWITRLLLFWPPLLASALALPWKFNLQHILHLQSHRSPVLPSLLMLCHRYKDQNHQQLTPQVQTTSPGWLLWQHLQRPLLVRGTH